MALPSSDTVDVPGLQGFYESLVKLGDRPAYVLCKKVEDRTRSTNLGRRNYTLRDLGPDADDDEPASDPFADLDATGDDEPDRNAGARLLERLATATCAWIVGLAEDEVGNEPGLEITLKVEVWAVKGEGCLLAPRLRARSRIVAPTKGPGSVETTIPLEKDDGAVEPGTWGELNRVVRQFLGTVQANNKHAFDIMREASSASSAGHREALRAVRSINTQLSTQLEAAYELIDKLIGDTLGFKIDLAELGVGKHQSMEDRSARTELQRQFVSQVGNLAQMWLAAKTGVLFDPGLIELMKIVQEDADLREALKRPELIKLLQNPEMRKVFIAVLNDAAASMTEPPPTPDASAREEAPPPQESP